MKQEKDIGTKFNAVTHSAKLLQTNNLKLTYTLGGLQLADFIYPPSLLINYS